MPKGLSWAWIYNDGLSMVSQLINRCPRLLSLASSGIGPWIHIRRQVLSKRFETTRPETTKSASIVDPSSSSERKNPEDNGAGESKRNPSTLPPVPLNNLEPLRTHQFDTFKFVTALVKAGYSHTQAIALMKCLRSVLVNGTEFAKSHYLSRGDLENVRLPTQYRY